MSDNDFTEGYLTGVSDERIMSGLYFVCGVVLGTIAMWVFA